MPKLVLLLVCAALFLPRLGAEQGKESLRGFKDVHVLVEELPDEAKGIGLTARQLQVDTELRLRRNGIAVSKFETLPSVYVKVELVQTSAPVVYAFVVRIEFHQQVRILQNNKVSIATTWSRMGLGAGGERMAEHIRQTVSDYLDEFSDDYLSVNPVRSAAAP